MSTGIAYVDETWNPECGCTKCSPGCLNCYAEDLHTKRHHAYLKGKKLPKQYAKPFNEIQLFTERLNIPLHWRKPRRILVPSMGDLFHESVPGEFIFKVIHTAHQAYWHKLLFLTKRVKQMAEFFKVYYSSLKASGKCVPAPNVHLGVTISNPEELWKIAVLTQIPAAHRWISFEPLLADIVGGRSKPFMPFPCAREKPIDWVVVGCESGPKRRPCKLEWIRSIVQQCKAAGVGRYVKQVEINGKVEHDMSKFPKWARVRELI